MMSADLDDAGGGLEDRSWLERPLSGLSCVIGWMCATIAFVGLVWFLGGPIEGDAAESVYSTWAISHGHLACAYPPASTFDFPNIARPLTLIAPLYPLLSGLIAALSGIGHGSPFPSQTQLGAHCGRAFVAMFHWSGTSNVILPTIRIAYLAWLPLMAGAIALLRACGRGRRGWEPVALVALACTPPVFMCILDYFHPQDLVTMGLVLGALACAIRRRWIWAGILVGLAITTQQFALLVLIPLAVVAPSDRRVRFIAAAAGAVVLVDLPMVILTSGRIIRSALIGSGDSASFGGTLVWETRLHGGALFTASRLLPLVLAACVAVWSVRRLGAAVLQPVPLVSLAAVSLSLRLVFEVNLFGYYFMAVAVALILLDVIRGRIRGETIAWIALVTLAFNPIPWGFTSNWTSWGLPLFLALPITIAAVGTIVVVRDVFHGHLRAYLLAWMIFVTLAFDPLLFGTSPLIDRIPRWLWQVVLVPTAVALAATPLVAAARAGSPVPALD
jgi:hypothetical protein